MLTQDSDAQRHRFRPFIVMTVFVPWPAARIAVRNLRENGLGCLKPPKRTRYVHLQWS